MLTDNMKFVNECKLYKYSHEQNAVLNTCQVNNVPAHDHK